jgi:hypothetical protein
MNFRKATPDKTEPVAMVPETSKLDVFKKSRREDNENIGQIDVDDIVEILTD